MPVDEKRKSKEGTENIICPGQCPVASSTVNKTGHWKQYRTSLIPSEFYSQKELKMTEETKTVDFIYQLASDYKIYAISGLHGTITPSGDLVINCYKERHPLPDSESFEVLKDGQLKFLKRSQSSTNTIIRDIPFALSINPMQARAFANWLNAKADEFEKRTMDVPDDLNG